MTSPVRSVFTYLGPDQVSEGFYIYEAATRTLRMVFADGQPVMLDDEPVTETVDPQHAEAVAKRLTRRIRKALRGEVVEGFSRRLTYENEVFA